MTQKITIDGREFDVDSLSDDAKNQVVSIRLADQRIAQLRQELAFVQTARNSYAKALAGNLPEAGVVAAQD